MRLKNPVTDHSGLHPSDNVSLFFQVIGHIIIPPGAPPPGGPKGLDAAGAPGIPPGAPKGDGAKGLTVDAWVPPCVQRQMMISLESLFCWFHPLFWCFRTWFHAYFFQTLNFLISRWHLLQMNAGQSEKPIKSLILLSPTCSFKLVD